MKPGPSPGTLAIILSYNWICCVCRGKWVQSPYTQIFFPSLGPPHIIQDCKIENKVKQNKTKQQKTIQATEGPASSYSVDKDDSQIKTLLSPSLPGHLTLSLPPFLYGILPPYPNGSGSQALSWHARRNNASFLSSEDRTVWHASWL